MFSRSKRVSSALFNEALQKGLSLKSSHFSLAVFKGGSASRVAVVVSKKVASKAVERNRLRRQARAWLKAELTAKPLPSAGVLIVFVNGRWEGPFPTALQSELGRLLLSVRQA